MDWGNIEELGGVCLSEVKFTSSFETLGGEVRRGRGEGVGSKEAADMARGVGSGFGEDWVILRESMHFMILLAFRFQVPELELVPCSYKSLPLPQITSEIRSK